MADPRYVRVLRKAYFLELLGEETYRQGSRKFRDGPASSPWRRFADTEARMQVLLRDELQRVAGDTELSRPAIRLARGLGRFGGLLSPALVARLIRRILEQRRYSQWAGWFRAQNPALWEELVQHELRQVEHFSARSRSADGGEGRAA